MFRYKAFLSPGRLQSKTLSTIDKRGLKINRNSVFNCHLSPVAIENYVLMIFYLRSLIVLAFLIGVSINIIVEFCFLVNC